MKSSVQVLCWPKSSFGFLSSLRKTQSFWPTQYFTGSVIPGRGEGCRVNQGGGRASVKVCHQADLCHLGKMSAQSYRTSGKKGKGLSTTPVLHCSKVYCIRWLLVHPTRHYFFLDVWVANMWALSGFPLCRVWREIPQQVSRGLPNLSEALFHWPWASKVLKGVQIASPRR